MNEMYYCNFCLRRGFISGKWSSDGCRLVSKQRKEILNCDKSQNCTYEMEGYITCQCDHMTSFAVLTDMSAVEVGLWIIHLI